MNKIKINTKINLIGQTDHKNFLEIQSAYGFAQRGGLAIPSNKHAKRLANDVNILKSSEVRTIIFNETIFSN
jgi:hypothetical protein